MIGQKVKGAGFCKTGVIKATRKEEGEVKEVLVYWGLGNLLWAKLDAVVVLPPETKELEHV